MSREESQQDRSSRSDRLAGAALTSALWALYGLAAGRAALRRAAGRLRARRAEAREW